MSKQLPNDARPRKRLRRFLLRAGFVTMVCYVGLWLLTVFWGVPQVKAEYAQQIGSRIEGADRDSAFAPCPFYIVVKTRYSYYPDPPVASGEYWWFFGKVRAIDVRPLPLVRGL